MPGLGRGAVARLVAGDDAAGRGFGEEREGCPAGFHHEQDVRQAHAAPGGTTRLRAQRSQVRARAINNRPEVRERAIMADAPIDLHDIKDTLGSTIPIQAIRSLARVRPYSSVIPQP